MKHWKETSEIFARAAQLQEAGGKVAVATVVRIDGSAYRRPGAKFLVDADGGASGSISGGCLEADVREIALRVMRENSPALLHYDTGADDHSVWGLGLGCSGAIDVFVQPVGSGMFGAIERVRELLAGGSPFAVSTVIGGPATVGSVFVVEADGARTGSTSDAALDQEIVRQGSQLLSRRETKIHAAGAAEVFTEVFVPPPHLVIFGAGDDAIPLCAYAADVGFRVLVVDHRGGFLTAPRFPAATRLFSLRPEDGTSSLPLGPNDYAVVKTHSFAHDREWVRRLLASGVSYVGVIGPRARTRKLLDEIGVSTTDRIFAPVGLDLGAEGPEQVAFSIVAELLAVRSSRDPASLREKQGTIHAG
ncbi:MAG TPA: XdhC family protein [Thermoanaerobaculia bacterium]